MGIALFGPKAVDAFVAPLAVGYWKKWEAMLSRTTTETPTTETSTTAPPSTTTTAETAAETKPMEKEDNKEGEESTAATTTTSTTTTTTTTTATTKKNTTTLKPLDLNQQFVILQCQQAMLDCLGTMGIEEQAERMDVTEMEDVFGERLIPLRCRARCQQLEGREQKDEWMNITENEYAMCFI